MKDPVRIKRSKSGCKTMRMGSARDIYSQSNARNFADPDASSTFRSFRIVRSK